jgi:hypothetical protein
MRVATPREFLVAQLFLANFAGFAIATAEQ